MADLSTKQRKALPSGSFAIPSKAPGSGSYPIPDASHARNALSRVSANGSPAEKAEVRGAVHRKFPDIGKPSGSTTANSGHDGGTHGGSAGRGGPAARSGRPRPDGSSGLDRAMSAHADRMHPVHGR